MERDELVSKARIPAVEILADTLDRDLLIDEPIVRTEHGPHPALADQPPYLVALAEHLAWGDRFDTTVHGLARDGLERAMRTSDSSLPIRTNGVICTYMVKKLTRTGNSVAVVLDKALLEAANLDEDASVEVSTDGNVIIIAPVKTKKDADRFRLAEDWAHASYAGAFKRLAK